MSELPPLPSATPETLARLARQGQYVGLLHEALQRTGDVNAAIAAADLAMSRAANQRRLRSSPSRAWKRTTSTVSRRVRFPIRTTMILCPRIGSSWSQWQPFRWVIPAVASAAIR